MRYRKIFLACLGVGVLATLPVAAQDINIGFYGPLTGPMSLSGIASKQGADLAIKQINAQGGVLGRKLVVVPYDDKSSPEEAVKGVTRMVSSDKVQFIVGSLHSGNILASAPVVEKAKVPELGIGTSPGWLEKGYTYLFRPLANTNIIDVQIAKTINDLKYKKVGALGRADEYGKTGVDDVKKQLDRYGIELLAEWFNPGDTDFTGQLTKLINAKVDVLVAFGVDADEGPIVKQARLNGFDGLVFGPESLSVPSVKEVAGRDADGAVFGSSYVIPPTPEQAINKLHEAFFKAFVAEFGKMPDSQTALRAYDSVKIFAEAAKRANSTDGTAVRDQIANLHGYEGLAGVFDFRNGNGEGIREARMFAIKDGRDILLEEYLKTVKK
jgi:branched-chain amino acid transport system substrate-binding protein